MAVRDGNSNWGVGNFISQSPDADDLPGQVRPVLSSHHPHLPMLIHLESPMRTSSVLVFALILSSICLHGLRRCRQVLWESP